MCEIINWWLFGFALFFFCTTGFLLGGVIALSKNQT